MPEQAYLSSVSSYAIGDTLGNISWDIQAERHGIELYWLIHYAEFRNGEVNRFLGDGWLNVPFYRLLDRAGICRNRVHIPAINTANRGEYHEIIARNIEWMYGRTVELAELGQHPRAGELFPGVVPMPDEFRRRFSFLARGGFPARYATFHPTSARFISDGQVAAGRMKRISVGAALRHLRTLRDRGINRLVVVGCCKSREINARFVERIRPELPGVEIIDTTGMGTLEDYFARLFGSVFHVACESGSAFFTAQLGIESPLVFRSVSTASRDNFASYFRFVPALQCQLDDQDCLDGDISDLAA